MSQAQVGRSRKSRILWGRVLVLLLAAVGVFMLGRWSANDGDAQVELDRARQRITELEEDNRNLQEQVRAREAGGIEASPSGVEATRQAVPPEPQEEQMAVPAGPPAEGNPDESRVYVVQRGDTLHGIAQQMYGDGAKFPLIVQANEVDAQALAIGQELLIPPDPEQE